METTTFGIITGIVLAVAATLAFLIQRARYLREIEPDLELSWPTNIRISQLSHSLKQFWAFYIDIEVENKSRNHAYNLIYEVELSIFPLWLDGKVHALKKVCSQDESHHAWLWSWT